MCSYTTPYYNTAFLANFEALSVWQNCLIYLGHVFQLKYAVGRWYFTLSQYVKYSPSDTLQMTSSWWQVFGQLPRLKKSLILQNISFTGKTKWSKTTGSIQEKKKSTKNNHVKFC